MHAKTGERKNVFVGPFPGCMADSLVNSWSIQQLNFISSNSLSRCFFL